MVMLPVGLLTFEERLRFAIGKRPVDRVAREAGVDRQTLRRMLNGKAKLRSYIDTVERIARACKVPAGWLAFGETTTTTLEGG